ncbi:MAG: DUF4062 domain-containing protein [Methanocellales archaeon]|nr:DUF4062 domain-containing protein [Methanocellales archaeon]
MAKPKVFVSSTYYDLKHLRSSLENFIESLGFEAILSEKGNIAFTPDIPLDESCYREAGNADIFVIIIGGRYGSEASGEQKKMPKGFFDRYDSITKKEYLSSVEMDVPTYILIDKAVYSDYETYLNNKNNKSVKYAHVDSINIFNLIEYILSQPKNNPIFQFDRYGDIEIWLKEQWAGLFRELINQRSKQTQISSLASQVTQLSEISETLKRYLEEVVSKVSPDESAEIIEEETKRIEEALITEKLKNNYLFECLKKYVIPDILVSDFRKALTENESLEDFLESITNSIDSQTLEENFFWLFTEPGVFKDANKAREALNLKPFKTTKIFGRRKAKSKKK